MPQILQSDNGREFKNKLFVQSISSWDGDCKIVYGRPRHPQSQGLVEQANGTVENMITAAMEQHKTKAWTRLLPGVIYTMNTSKSSTTKFMPFEVTFNKKPNVGASKEFVEIDEKDVEKPVACAEEIVASDPVNDPVNKNPANMSSIPEEQSMNEEEEVEVEEEMEEIVEETDEEAEEDEFENRRVQQEKADALRKVLNENKVTNGSKLINKHDHKRNKKTRVFKVGDKVSVKIPRIDRGNKFMTLILRIYF